MAPQQVVSKNVSGPPIYVVSGGIGASGEQLVRTVLAQFENADVPVVVVSRVHRTDQIEALIAKAVKSGGTIVHSMVNSYLRRALIFLAQKHNVPAIDIVGPLQEHVAAQLNVQPSGQPGLYRQLYQTYFDRVEAIEYTRAVDDGVAFDRWHEAEIVLVGVSRVGKTPLSLYLSMLGWKVVNVPLVMNISPPSTLFELDRNRVVGLTIDPNQLLQHRRHRQKNLGVGQRHSPYVDPLKLYDEIEAAEKIMRRNRFPVVDVTNKPIETTAEEVIAIINRRVRSEEDDSD